MHMGRFLLGSILMPIYIFYSLPHSHYFAIAKLQPPTFTLPLMFYLSFIQPGSSHFDLLFQILARSTQHTKTFMLTLAQITKYNVNDGDNPTENYESSLQFLNKYFPQELVEHKNSARRRVNTGYRPTRAAGIYIYKITNTDNFKRKCITWGAYRYTGIFLDCFIFPYLDPVWKKWSHHVTLGASLI